MKIALFGGTFDPVHLGHLAVARAAADRFDLGLVYLVPADIPPHKQKRKLTDFQHRFAMLALATAQDKRFIPSLLDSHTGHPNYSIETVRRLKSTLGKSDKLYFLIGMDAFKDINTWRQPRALPKSLRPTEPVLRALGKQRAGGTVALPGVNIHLLAEVREPVSSTQIRAAAYKSAKQLSRYVPGLVAAYIKKEHLYTVKPSQPESRGVLRSKMLSLQREHHQEPR